MSDIEQVEAHKSFGGIQGVYRHRSRATGTAMTFAVYVSPRPGPLATLTYLSGLTCTHANVMDKGEYRALASELGLMIVCPDTSPRGEGVPDDEAYAFGQGAGSMWMRRRRRTAPTSACSAMSPKSCRR